MLIIAFQSLSHVVSSNNNNNTNNFILRKMCFLNYCVHILIQTDLSAVHVICVHKMYF